MQAVPLHPAIVHLPLGIAMILPLVAGAIAWALWSQRLPRGAWLVVVALLALTFGGGLLAMRTGEAEEEKVEAIVSERLLHEHEERGELFVWTTGIVLVLAAGAGFLRKGAAARYAPIVVSLATLAVTALALNTGKAGGELVYVHGAAKAYSNATAGAGTVPGLAARQPDDDED